MVAPPEEEDIVRFALPGGEPISACKAALANRASFFASLADEIGPTTHGDAELQHLMSSLSPGARRALPLLINALGSRLPEKRSSLLEDELLTEKMLLHTFSVAHLLGASEVLEAARRWAAEKDSRRLAGAIAAVDADVDAAVLRTAAEYSLDRLCALRLIHAAAEADAKEAAQVLLTVGDVENQGQGATGGAIEQVDILDHQGRTPLHICAIRDSPGVASVLIQASANIDALCDPIQDGEESDGHDDMDVSMGTDNATKDKNPLNAQCVRTPLHLASYHDNADMVQLLLDAKANVASCVKNCSSALTPLHECASADASRAARILAPLAAAAADASSAKLSSVLEGMMPIDSANGQSPDGGEPDAVDADKVEGPQWACFLDPLQAKVGHHGSTPLHVAAENDAPGVVAALLQARADPSVDDDQGDTPVHCAMLYGSPCALETLLAMGAPASSENKTGELPLHIMAEFSPGADEEISPALERRHHARSMRAQGQLVENLRVSGLLSAAVAHRASGDVGNTPLHSVARWDHLGAQNAVQLLVRVRADLEVKNEEGRTALSIALRRHGKSGKVAKLLRQLGAQEQKEEDEAQKEDIVAALGGRVLPLIPQDASQQDAKPQNEDIAAALGGCLLPLAPQDPSQQE